ncbi:SEC-C metal-binding domain-containing protein [Qipengyuania algicida]
MAAAQCFCGSGHKFAKLYLMRDRVVM